MSESIGDSLVLALYPNMIGLCYAVFEDNLTLIDWGIKTARKADRATLEWHAERLLNIFSPAVIILPKRRATTVGSSRLRVTVSYIEDLASACGVGVHLYTRSDIQEYFIQCGAKSKDAMARVIVGRLPEFAQHLPPRRKIWMSEDYRMGLFDAVALAILYFETTGWRGTEE